MPTIRGTIERITFHNEDTGFTVFRLERENAAGSISCVGVAPTLQAGMSVALNGREGVHKRFGAQFEIESYEIIRPTTPEGILRLLSSGIISSIGQVRAQAIVAKFGVQTLDILDTQPQRLKEVSGIGPKTLGKIREAWDGQRHLRALIMFLQPFGVTPNLAVKINRAYGSKAQAVISENPYRLIDDIWGVGFKKADAIAQKLGYARDTNKRIQAGIRFVLEESSGDGHCFLPQGELVEKAAALLEVEQTLVTHSLDHAIDIKNLVREDSRIYLASLCTAETQVAQMVATRLAATRGESGANAREWVCSHAQAKGWQVDDKQVAACMGALENPVFVLTGGPGTGKTTTLYLLVSYLQSQKLRVSLAAPTGRAAQRMGGVAGSPAQTLHRLLEFRPSGGRPVFNRNASRPLETDVLVIDEVSMVDIQLMRTVLDALAPGTKLVLVGDSNQLPSIGPGNVLADLITSGRVPHVQLTTLFRQAAQSRIVTAAHEIIHGRTPLFVNAQQDNCFFIGAEEPEECLSSIIDLVCTRLPRRYGLDPRTDIQVLSPMHRGPIGTININKILQAKFSRGGPSLSRGENIFTAGDRVMQLRNNYDRGVFNGDIGYVAEVDEHNGLSVDFDGNRVAYELREMDELIHAYCISIHKSQGCEFRAVVIPMSTQHYVMLKRNLVYTALTRARELCVFAGSMRALGIAVRAQESSLRYTALAARISASATPGAGQATILPAYP